MVVLSAAETNADDDAATVWSAVHRAAAANWESAPATRVGIWSTWSVFGLKPSGPGVSWYVRSKLCGHDSTRAQDALQPRGFALGGRTQKCRAAIPRSPDGHVQCSSASAAAGASRLTAVRR